MKEKIIKGLSAGFFGMLILSFADLIATLMLTQYISVRNISGLSGVILIIGIVLTLLSIVAIILDFSLGRGWKWVRLCSLILNAILSIVMLVCVVSTTAFFASNEFSILIISSFSILALVLLTLIGLQIAGMIIDKKQKKID